MPRPQRINIEDGWYHVFNRGISRKTVCFSEFHFDVFKTLIGEISDLYNIKTHAFCMMKNHYHLLLHTTQANLSDGMWYFGRKFATLVNKDIHGDGPLFRSRFRSILIEDDRYFLQVHRYIHLNPVEGGLSSDPYGYHWSSCQYFCGKKPSKISGLETKFVGQFFKTPEEYDDFLKIGNNPFISNFYSRKNIPSVISKASE